MERNKIVSVENLMTENSLPRIDSPDTRQDQVKTNDAFILRLPAGNEPGQFYPIPLSQHGESHQNSWSRVLRFPTISINRRLFNHAASLTKNCPLVLKYFVTSLA